jgi:hypothetical protein
MASTPSSQSRPTVSTIITKTSELPMAYTDMDDLINILAEKNRTTQFRSNNNRAAFWRLVFDSDWNTGRHYMKPAPLADRDLMQTQVQVGVLRIDCPNTAAKMSKKRKRDDGGAESHPSAEQSSEAAAFVNVVVKEDELFFSWTDQQGQAISKSLVRFDEGLSSVDALSMAVERWDTHETARVRSWNKNMVVFWARERLMNRLETRAMVFGKTVVSRTKITMDVDVLVPLVSASELFKTLAQTYAATSELLIPIEKRGDGLIW